MQEVDEEAARNDGGDERRCQHEKCPFVTDERDEFITESRGGCDEVNRVRDRGSQTLRSAGFCHVAGRLAGRWTGGGLSLIHI